MSTLCVGCHFRVWEIKTRSVVDRTEAKKSDVIFRHTKNLSKGTLFEDEGVVWRVVQGRTKLDGNDVVFYVEHDKYRDKDPPLNECERSSFAEVKEWHLESRDRWSFIMHYTNIHKCIEHACIVSRIHSLCV